MTKGIEADHKTKAPPTPEQLAEQCGRWQLTKTETCEVLEVEHLRAYARHYRKGQLLAEAEVRAALLKSAKAGSNPAQVKYLDIAKATAEKNARGR